MHLDLTNQNDGWKRLNSSEINFDRVIEKSNYKFHPKITVLDNHLYTIIDDRFIRKSVFILRYNLSTKDGWKKVGNIKIDDEELDKSL